MSEARSPHLPNPHLPPPGRRHRLRVLLAAAAALALVPALFAVVQSSQAAAAPSPAAVTPSAVPAPPTGFSTVFSDDFTGAANTGLDTTKWLYDLGTSYPGGAGNWGTGEVESETNSTANVFQDGSGHLVIKPIRSASGAWTSGRVETQSTSFGAPADGEMEITASIEQPNPAVGLGYWPAFWAMGAAARPVAATNWPSIGELDILEDVNGMSDISHTFHCGVDPGGPCNETTGIGSGLLACGGCQTAFHTYSVIVDRTNTAAEQLRFLKDGVVEFTVNESQVDHTTWVNAVDHGFFVILDLAIGGAFPNAICGCASPSASTTSGAGMTVDYVAVYQKPASGTTVPPTTTAPPTTAPTTSPPPAGGGGSAFSQINATSASASHNATSEVTSDVGGGTDFGQLANGAWAEYPNVNFGTTGATQFVGRVASGAAAGVSGLVDVRLDSVTGPVIGSFAIANTGGWQTWRTVPANISRVTGTHTVFLTFDSGQPAPFVSLHWFDFGA
ncbi:MAG TPA: glycoside hydrolase family 16 protein [Pseudonocardiaceae bacterium]|nr:glycoside hydrolase family 16 protein [Pseudonocardiaceae bacterium]